MKSECKINEHTIEEIESSVVMQWWRIRSQFKVDLLPTSPVKFKLSRGLEYLCEKSGAPEW